MTMPSSQIQIQIEIKPEKNSASCSQLGLYYNTNIDNKPLESKHLPLTPEMTYGHIRLWLLNVLKPVFMTHLPTSNLDIKWIGIPKNNLDLTSTIENIEKTLKTTNANLQALKPLHQFAKTNQGILFYNCDNHEQFLDLYTQLEKTGTPNLHHASYAVGYNPKTREFEEAVPPSPEELLRMLHEKSIGHLITINMYLAHAWLEKYHIHLGAWLNFLGVELVLYDYDIYDLTPTGYLSKMSWNFPGNRRFSIFPHAQKPWDHLSAHDDIVYVPYYRNIVPGQRPNLKTDYELLFLSHSRHEDVKSTLQPLLFILHHVSPTPNESVFENYQLWYYALRSLLLEQENLDLLVRMRLNFQLYFLYLALISFLKFEILESLESASHPLKIFGDPGWGLYFPNHFQNRYLGTDEKREIFSTGKAVHLLINANYSYLECNPAIHDPMYRNVPYLTLPALSKTPEMEGLAAAEYSSLDELHAKLSNIQETVLTPTYLDALTQFKKIWDTIGQDTLRKLKEANPKPGIFDEIHLQHEVIAKNRLKQYIQRNSVNLKITSDTIFLGKQPTFKPEDSAFFSRRFVQKMLTKS